RPATQAGPGDRHAHRRAPGHPAARDRPRRLPGSLSGRGSPREVSRAGGRGAQPRRRRSRGRARPPTRAAPSPLRSRRRAQALSHSTLVAGEAPNTCGTVLIMRFERHPRAWWLTVVLVGAWLGVAAAAHAAPDQPSVLILLSGQPGSSGATAVASGIRDVLQKDWAFRISIELEHVDVANFASPEDEERRLRTILGIKYKERHFDLIVAALPEAFQFVLRARDDLWPGTPVLVC